MSFSISTRLSSVWRLSATLAGLAIFSFSPLGNANAQPLAIPASADPLWDFLPIGGYLAMVEVPARGGAHQSHETPVAGEVPQLQEYTVAEGDTVRDIAERFALDIPTVLGANAALATDPDALDVGMVLTILPTVGVVATLPEGETLSLLAARHGMDASLVASYNQIEDADRLAAGTRLILPGAQPLGWGSPSATERAGDEGIQRAASVPALGMRALLPDVAPASPAAPAAPVAQASFSPVWPARGQITTTFGQVGSTSPRGHAGLDIAAPQGTPILAADAGTVTSAGADGGGYGLLVVINHGNGVHTWYAHLSSFAVTAGERVNRGELIGRMGSTGYSTGSHLHFEVRIDGELRNPQRYLP